MKLGIIGTGRMAKRAIKELEYVPEIEVVAVYNPNYDHAKSFASRIQDAAGSALSAPIKAAPNLEAFGEIVDAVYIATPHGTHHHYAQRMLEIRKHVLCEKPMVMDADQAKELYNLAQEHGLVLMEAIKTAYCPGFVRLQEVVESGVIGKLVDVEAAFTRLTLPGGREFEPGGYGGSFAEFGTYNMLPIFRFLGIGYKGVNFQSVITETGVDGYTKAIFDFGDAFATSKTGLTAKSEGQLIIAGEKGYILAPSPWWRTSYFEVRYEDPNKIDRYECEFEGDGLRYEFREFTRRIDALSEGIGQNVEEPEEDTADGLIFSKEKEEAMARAGVYDQFRKSRG